MKTKLQWLLALSFIPFLGIAQQTMSAESIRNSINQGQAVALTDVIITGDLDLTKLSNMKQVESKSEGDHKTYESTVTSAVSFTNCTFKGKVLGYYNPDNMKVGKKENAVYNTNFDGPVTFEKCNFENEVTFKYSDFKSRVSFAGSKFQDPAEFKYSKFAQGPDFKGSEFSSLAVFKYVEFPAGVDFSNSSFRKAADFKYAKFNGAGSFENAKFRVASDFKYASFHKAISMKGASFEGLADFKYAKKNDQDVTLNELLSQ